MHLVVRCIKGERQGNKIHLDGATYIFIDNRWEIIESGEFRQKEQEIKGFKSTFIEGKIILKKYGIHELLKQIRRYVRKMQAKIIQRIHCEDKGYPN